VRGLHLTADAIGCACDAALLTDAPTLAATCRALTAQAGLTVVDEKWFTFPPREGRSGGVTGVLLLAESHVAVHTWPEQRGVTLDVYVCNFSEDNSHRARALMRQLLATLNPAKVEEHAIERGAA
jgi:spermidine synthase